MEATVPASTNATIAQIGPIAQTLDPVIQENTVFSHQTAPQSDTVQSILPVLISNTRNSSFSYAAGISDRRQRHSHLSGQLSERERSYRRFESIVRAQPHFHVTSKTCCVASESR